jgi:hypothetical protein
MKESKECICGATRFKFNLNEHIRFRPTELGMRVYRAYWLPYGNTETGHPLQLDNEGYAELQLHEFIKVFGNNIEYSTETEVLFINSLEEQLQALRGTE